VPHDISRDVYTFVSLIYSQSNAHYKHIHSNIVYIPKSSATSVFRNPYKACGNMSYTESRYISPPPPVSTNIKTSPAHGHSRSRNSSITTLRGPATPYDPLTSAVSTAQARYTISNPKSLEAHNNACHYMPGGNTRTVLHATPFPLTWSMYRFL